MTTRADRAIAFVRAFQTRHGLVSDGDAGAKTFAKLDEIAPPPAPVAAAGFGLSDRDRSRLIGVEPRMVKVVERAAEITGVPFIVVEGLRTLARQQELYAKGRTTPGPKVTWTMKSKHLDGLAVDLAPLKGGTIDWNDLSKFDQVADAMFRAAAELGVTIRWGADWNRNGKPRESGEADSPHFEIA